MTFTLDEVLPWGRPFDEYVAMFALSEADLRGRLLGCGDGPASFNAEATERGIRVVSCDPIYRFSGADIELRVRDTYDRIVGQVAANRRAFVWDRFRDPLELGQARLRAAHRFLEDFEAGLQEGRYVDAALPILPFRTGELDLALCSHFLFLYSRQHDLAFHLASLRELGRVAAEVRVFPLLTLEGEPSPYVEVAADALRSDGWQVERVRVEYEFQRGGNEMLRLSGPNRG